MNVTVTLPNSNYNEDGKSMEKNKYDISFYYCYKPQHYTANTQPSFHKQFTRTKGSCNG